MINFFLIISGIVVFLFFAYAALVSWGEHEPQAAFRFFITAWLATLPFLATVLISFQGKMLVSLLLFLFLIAGILVWLIPNGKNRRYRQVKPATKIDERDTMFSRNELMPDTENFEDYLHAPSGEKNFG